MRPRPKGMQEQGQRALQAKPPAAADTPMELHYRTARRVFLGALLYTGAITLMWLIAVITHRDSGFFFHHYNVDMHAVRRVVISFLLFSVLWGWLWYHIRHYLLRRFAGFSDEELRLTFAARMDAQFSLQDLLTRHAERRIRIIDMISRRGRFVTIGLASFLYVYTRVSQNPEPEFLTMGLRENLFDAIAFNWINLAAYNSSGFLGRVVFGAQSRLMDGVLARANCLLITTLWSLFKFVMVPIGMRLAALFPPHTYAAMFAFVWVSYMASDGLAEVVGSLFGKQRLRVWGVGEVNRKSVAGTWACCLGSLTVCLAIIIANRLPLPWIGLAVAISMSNTVLELFSPRGTDDFTMATANALLCWAFGVLIYAH